MTWYTVRPDYSRMRIRLVGDSVEERQWHRPYFYAVCEREELLGPYDYEETELKPVLMKGEKYVVTDDKVYRVYGAMPNDIPRIARELRGRGCRVGGFNVRYTVRVSFDLVDRYFRIRSLYEGGVDESFLDKLSRLRIGVFDIEVVDGRPRLVSVLEWSYGEEPRISDVLVYVLPEETDELVKEMSRHRILSGYNILGFDIPWLKRAGIRIDEGKFAAFDLLYLLNTYGNALKVGSMRSLLEVSRELREEAGILEKELRLKEEGKRILKEGSLEKMAVYNANDVVLTAKLMNIFFPFAAALSAMTLVPIEEVVRLPSGMVAEYFAFRRLELEGYMPEYRETNVSLSASRVWLEEPRTYENIVQLDVKMMYPSFVLHNYIDPTLHVGGGRFDPEAGPGLLYKIVRELAELRKVSKRLKKMDERFGHVDAGIKSVLNALAYGVYAKRSGPALMGNPWCPARIFYGTFEAQMETIRHLRNMGYRVIYSDTDSFFVSFTHRPKEEEIGELVAEANMFLSRWGLEVDLEGVWERMIIYSKKNYLLIGGGGKIVVKGSALRTKLMYGVPDCVDRTRLILLPREERRRYLEREVSECPDEMLLLRPRQQLWRLFLLDRDRVKRADKSRYMGVVTPWEEPSFGYLKKIHPGHMKVPRNSPVISLLLGGDVELEEMNPFEIVEIEMLPHGDGLLVRREGEVVYVEPRRTWYVLEKGERIMVPTMYHQLGRGYRLVGMRGELSVRRWNGDIRRIVLRYSLEELRKIGLL